MRNIKILICIGLASFLTYGCSMLKPEVEPAGITDYVQLPVGTVITKVPLPTDEAGKLYNIVISKPSIAISLDCWDRVKK